MSDVPAGLPQRPHGNSEERLRLAVEAAGMGQWDWDIVTGKVVWSQRCRVLYGLPLDGEVSYDAFLGCLHFEDRDRIDAALRRAVEERGIYNEEKRCVWPDGSVHWTASRGQVYCDDAGQPIRMTGVTFDITQQKRVEAALRVREAELRLIADHVPAMIAYIDTAHRFHYANRTFERFFSGGDASVEGRPIEDVLEPFNGMRVCPLLARTLSGETLHCETEGRRQDGAERAVELTLVPNLVEGGAAAGVFAFLVDVTERIEAEKGRLERAQLEAANSELNAFAYTVAHDLRAPLRGITGFAGVLRESDGGVLSEDGRTALEQINNCARRLQELIAALLHYARSARNDIQVEELDLTELAQAASDTLRPAYPNTSVRIGTLPKVRGDRSLIWDVLLNLIGNALKFSSKRVEPVVDIGATMTSRGQAVFVRDNGVGFDSAHADRLFHVFHRLHAESQFPGTGIGLAYARRVLLRHGAEIWAESAHGQGATFYFTLPAPPEG